MKCTVVSRIEEVATASMNAPSSAVGRVAIRLIGQSRAQGLHLPLQGLLSACRFDAKTCPLNCGLAFHVDNVIDLTNACLVTPLEGRGVF